MPRDLLGCWRCGNVLVPMLAPYARMDFNASDADIGYLFSFPCASAFAFSYMMASFTNSLGRKPVFVISLLGMALACLCQGAAGSFGWLLLGRTFGGMWLNILTTAKVYINETTDWDVTGNERSYWFAQLSLCQNVAKLFAPALGGALSHYGLNVPSLATALVNIVGAPLVYLYVVESPRFLQGGGAERKARKGPYAANPQSEVLRMRLFCIASMFTTACMKLAQTVFALFAIDKYGLGAIDIGFIYLLGGLGTIVASRFVPYMNRQLGPYNSGIITSFVHAAAMLALPMFPFPEHDADSSRAWQVSLVCMICCFVVMSAAASVTTSFQNIISGELDNQPIVQARGFQVRQGGMMMVPILASRLFRYSLAYPWIFGSTLAAAAALPVWWMRPVLLEAPLRERFVSGYGEEFQDDNLTDLEVRALGEFMKKLLVKKHLKWSKDRVQVEKLLQLSIPELPISDRQIYYEALIQYSTT